MPVRPELSYKDRRRCQREFEASLAVIPCATRPKTRGTIATAGTSDRNRDRLGPIMRIPKIVHVCWFGGGKMSPQIERCMHSIRGLEKLGYELKIWDEATYDIQRSKRVRDAYEARRWSLVSNYVRLDVLKRFGGVYLDTDVEVVRPFDDLLDNELFMGFMWDCTLGTAVIGSVPGHRVVEDILRDYEEKPETFRSPNNDTFTDYFLARVPDFRLTGRRQRLGTVLILDKFAFEQPSLFKRNNYTVHHFEQSWKANSSLKRVVKAAVIKTCSLWLYRKYVCWNSLRVSHYRPEFRRSRAYAYGEPS